MNKIDFLNAICGKPVSVTIDGLDLEIRSLTLFETEQIHNEAQNNDLNAALLTIIYGLVTPELTKADLAGLKLGNPGLMMKIAKEISKLSGLTSEDSPMGGNG